MRNKARTTVLRKGQLHWPRGWFFRTAPVSDRDHPSSWSHVWHRRPPRGWRITAIKGTTFTLVFEMYRVRKDATVWILSPCSFLPTPSSFQREPARITKLDALRSPSLTPFLRSSSLRPPSLTLGFHFSYVLPSSQTASSPRQPTHDRWPQPRRAARG